MLLRKVLLVAVVAAPLAWTPTPVDAQARGLDRAAEATANADAVAGWTKSNAAKRRPADLPPGIAKRFDGGQTLPPGIDRTRPSDPAPLPAEPEPEPESEPEPDPVVDEPVTCVIVMGLPQCGTP